MTFLPKRDILSLEELYDLSCALIDRGVRKLRITGGEPLMRRDIVSLIKRLGKHLGDGLDEITMTTNATRLKEFAGPLHQAGIKRINVSLDTLNPQRFEQLSRRSALPQVLAGIDAALAEGIAVKINTVALRGINEDELVGLIRWTHGKGCAITLIETMPLGEVDEDRTDYYLPLTEVAKGLRHEFSVIPSTVQTGGPARYYNIPETGGVLGLITPLSNNFCDGCNRIRITATGRVYMCLGHDDYVDLRSALRSPDREEELDQALARAMRTKPRRHGFEIARSGTKSDTVRHMSVTGG